LHLASSDSDEGDTVDHVRGNAGGDDLEDVGEHPEVHLQGVAGLDQVQHFLMGRAGQSQEHLVDPLVLHLGGQLRDAADHGAARKRRPWLEAVVENATHGVAILREHRHPMQ
jgi:hypothetical protein